MKISTTIRALLPSLALALAFVASVNAQRVYDLKIDAPASIAGTYLAVPFSSFGTADYCGGAEFAGELAIADDGISTAPNGTPLDGCEAITSNVSGKIALINRGLCNFSVKAYNAQQVGAIGVIICQNVADAPFAGAAGTNAALVTIPVFMISKADCDKIRVEVPNGVDVELDPKPSAGVPANLNVLWGDAPGDGDFTNGMTGWTVNNISTCDTLPLWQWDDDGIVAGGAFGGISLNSSPTACEGIAYFYSDFFDNGGDPNNQGGGPCPSPQEGELVSPSIDLSGFNVAGVSLYFYQNARHFTNSQYFVGWSTDGGNTWTEIQINTGFVVNTVTYDEALKIPMPGVAGSSDLRVRFRHIGNYYYWAVDDVKIVEQEANNLRVNSNFFAVPQNRQIPFGQLDPIYFLADVENIGASEQTAVNLTVKITSDATGQEVFSSTLPFSDIPGNTLVENSLFEDAFVPDVPIGDYTGVYTIDAAETDFDLSDNEQTFHLSVTPTTFAKEAGRTRILTPAGNNWSAGEPHNWAIGNAYYIEGANDLFATSISFSLANVDSLVDEGIELKLYYWTDTNGDNQADPDEREELGSELYGITGDETDTTIITVPFGDNTPDPPSLDTDGQYLVMIEWTGDDGSAAEFWVQASDTIDYNAMIYTTDTIESPRYASVVAIDETLEDEIYGLTGGLTFGADIVPVIRLNVTPVSPTKTPLPEENLVEVFPNPASSQASLKVAFVNPQAHVYVQVLDVMGRVAFENTYDNVHKTMLPLDASRLSAGTYTVHVMTAEGVRTTKLVVSK